MNTFQEFSQPLSETPLCAVDSLSINSNVNSDKGNLSSTVIPLKRTRAKRSCDFCRRRKSRCDADSSLPCTNCKAWGYSCEFQTVRKKRGPPSVYVDNLEKKCKKMESLLAALTKCSVKDLERNNYQHPGCRRPTSPPSIQTESSSDEEEDNDSDEHLVEQTDVVSKDYDSIRYTGHSSTGVRLFVKDLFQSQSSIPWPGRDNIVLKLMSQDELMIVRTEKSLTTGKSDMFLDVGLSMRTSVYDSIIKSSSTTFKKPEKHQLDKMIDIYFSHIHLMLPIIDKPKFLDQYRRSSSSHFPILIQAVLALSFRFAGQNMPDLVVDASEFGDQYFRRVMKRLQEFIRSRMCHVQAALLLTLYLDMDEGDVESIQWRTLGNAIRMAQDLGLHRSCAKWNLPRSEIETRHRVFYACYLLDRWLGARAGKPLTILDRDFDTEMPSPFEITDHDNDTDSNQAYPIYRSFIFLIKLSEILGRILKSLYAPKAKLANANAGIDDPTILTVLDRRLKAWKLSLEEPLHGVYLSEIEKANLYVYYYTTMLLLHRPFTNLPIAAYPELQTIATESMTICMDAARQVSNIIQKQESHMNDPVYYYLLCTPSFFIYSLFQSSLVYLSSALKSRRLHDIQAFHQSIDLIKAKSIGPAPRAVEILDMLVAINSLQIDSSNTQMNPVLESRVRSDSSTINSPLVPVAYIEKSVPYIADVKDEVPKVKYFQHRMMNTSIVGGLTSEIQQQNSLSKRPYTQQIDQQQPQQTVKYYSTQEQPIHSPKYSRVSQSSFAQRQNYSPYNRSQHQATTSHHRSFSMGQMNSPQQHIYSHHTRSISHDNLAHMITPQFSLQNSAIDPSSTPVNTSINFEHMLSHDYRNQYNVPFQQQQQQAIIDSYTPSLPQVPQAYTAAYNPNVNVSSSTVPPSSLNWSDWDVYIGHQNNPQK
ncbi:unnamed protein product [Mucor hiemalis]